MKVEKKKFDELLSKIIRTKPAPRKKIKTRGKGSPKTPILPPSSPDKEVSSRSKDS